MIYVDHNATTPLAATVREAMRPYYEHDFGNPSAVYQAGVAARAAIEKARSQVASALKVAATELTFTGSGTESDNHAVLGALFASPRRKIVISAVEHAAVAQSARWAAKHLGREVLVAPFRVSGGQVDPEPFIELLDEDVALVSCMYANNETGVVFPIEQIFAAAREKGIICHTDAVQAFGKIPVDPRELGADLVTISGHKIYGPKGVGALYQRRGVPLEPLLHGGPQENSRRAGTESVAHIVGLGAAAARVPELDASKLAALRDAFEEKLGERMGEQVVFHQRELPRTPNTSSVCLTGADANLLLIKLDREQIALSTGSACHSGSLSVSKVLLDMGVKEKFARGTLRVSFGFGNTMDEVDRLVDTLARLAPRGR